MEILSPTQRILLKATSESRLPQTVYFTGGTLLSHYYLQHRKSLDLDFFALELPDDIIIAAEVKSIADRAHAKVIRPARFPSRWQYFFDFGKEEIKFDVVYFPFPSLGKQIILPEFNLKADSLKDIAVNKTHACYERDAPRDTFDLYTIMKKTGWKRRLLN